MKGRKKYFLYQFVIFFLQSFLYLVDLDQVVQYLKGKLFYVPVVYMPYFINLN